MVMIVVINSVFLSTNNCSTWREGSSGDRSYEIGDDKLTNWKKVSVMLCLSYPVLGHDIALSNALRCIISVS